LSLDENDTAVHDEVRSEEQSPERRRPAKRDDDDGGDKGAEPNASKKGGEDQQNKAEKEQEKTAKKSSPWVKVIGAIVVVAAIAGGTYYYFSTMNEESTDDAYTDGRSLTIAPKIAGYVTELLVNDNQFVKAGDVLIRIDPRDYVVARDQARANLLALQAQQHAAELGIEIAKKNFPARLMQAQGQLQQAQGQLFQAQTDYKRQHSVAREATTQQNVDQSTAQLQLAQGQVTAAQAAVDQAEPVQQNIETNEQQTSQIEAQVKQAQAQLDQAELNLSYATIRAPQDGWITKRNVEVGNYLQVGATIFSIVTPQVWVTANFKETQLNRMRPGQPVKFHVDAYPGLKLEGHVDSVQLGSGSRFTAFPPENATGNFVKIVQRVPVKLLIDRGMDPANPLPLGISVEPTVDVSSAK
jgi:membrane fusion protein (multidrug efflux system)